MNNLTGNIDGYGIGIERDNTTLDGQGFTIVGKRSIMGVGVTLGSNNVTVRNLVIKTFPWGVYPTTGTDKNIINNSISNCGSGIHFWGGSNSSISGNVIRGNDVGITIKGAYTQTLNVFEYGSFNTIERNIITNNKEGIHVENANHNTFRFNSVAENQNGVNLIAAQTNIFTENNFTRNDCGIYFVPPIYMVLPSNNNQFYLNNFVSNPRNVVPQTVNDVYNYWDSDSEGNYWSDYNGSGVYVIDENNTDHYPLGQQVEVSLPTPTPTPIPSTPTPVPSTSTPVPTITPAAGISQQTTVIVAAVLAVVIMVTGGLLVYHKRKHYSQ